MNAVASPPSTFDRVKAILVDQLGNQHADGITPAAKLSDLDADSLDVVELELECEDAFGFRFTMGDADGFGQDPTIAHVVETIDRLVVASRSPVEL